MDFQNSINKTLKTNKLENLKDSSIILNSFYKDVSDDSDVIQYLQLKILLEIYPTFIYDLIISCNKQTHCHVLETISKQFDDQCVSAQIYAYFLYSVMVACGIRSDKVEWIDPYKNSLDFTQNKTFGTGAYVEKQSEYVIDDKAKKLKGIKTDRTVLTIPYGIKSISADFLSDKSKIKLITFPASVVEIECGSFKKCKNLEIVVLPDSIREIPDKIFADNKKLSLVIAPRAKKVGEHAFSNTNISSLKRIGSNNIEEISKFAFEGCTQLKKLELANAKILGIGAFANCVNVSYIEISSDTKLLGGSVSSLFVQSVRSQKSIEYSLKHIKYFCKNGIIPKNLFNGCESVKKIEIIGKVNTIESSAFKDCVNLESLSIDFVGNEVAEYAFSNCSSLRDFSFLKNATKLNNYAFSECKALETIEFSNAVNLAGEGVFAGCSSLRELKIKISNGEIPKKCFYQCKSLETYKFLDEIVKIKEEAFYQCVFKNGLVLSDKLIKIETGAFCECIIKEKLVLPAKTTIEKNTFSGINEIKEVAFYGLDFVTSKGENILPYELFDNSLENFNSKFKQIKNIRIFAKKIPAKVFSGWKNIQKVIFANPISILPEYAFAECTSLEGIKFADEHIIFEHHSFENCISLKRVKFNNSKENSSDVDLANVNKISSYAFAGCSFDKICIPENCLVEHNAFYQCTNVVLLDLSFSDDTLANNMFSIFASSADEFNANYTKLKNIVIDGITHLKKDMFSAFKQIESIEFKLPIEFLEEGCFSNLSSLTSLKGTYIGTEIHKELFFNCAQLVEIFDFPNANSIAEYAFYGCKSITKISFGKVYKVGASAFEKCENLTTVQGVFNCDVIGEKAFLGCSLLSDFSFIISAKTIKQYAFAETKNNSFPNGVANIEAFAYSGVCFPSIFEVPKNVKIDENAFYKTYGFSTLVFENTDIITTDDKHTLPYKLFADTMEEFLTNENVNYSLVEFVRVNGQLSKGAFKGWKNIQKVIVASKNLQIVPCECFADCSNLTGIKFNSEKFSIEKRAFENCKQLSVMFSIKKPTGVDDGVYLSQISHIEAEAFKNCYSIKKIEVKLDNLSCTEQFLRGCRCIETIRILVDTNIINGFSLYKLFENNIDLFNTDYTKLKSIIVSGAEKIPAYCFANYKFIKEIEFENDIAMFGKSCFEGSVSLQTIKIGENGYLGDSIPSRCFYNCTSLKNLIGINSSKIKQIGSYAFFNTASFDNHCIYPSIEYIGGFAFAGSSASTIELGNSLIKIGLGAFARMGNLSNIVMPARFSHFGLLFDWKESENSIEVSQYVEGNLNTYYIPESLKTVTITEGELKTGMFSGLHLDLSYMPKPKAIPSFTFYEFNGVLIIDLNDVVSVGASAFGKSKISKLTIGSEIIEISETAFSGADITDFSIDKNKRYIIFDNMLLDNDANAIIYVSKNISGEITIPKNISEISDRLFEKCENLISIDCCNVSIVGEMAFAHCINLKKVIFSDNLECLCQNVLEGCYSIEYLQLPFIGESTKKNRNIEYLISDTKFINDFCLVVTRDVEARFLDIMTRNAENAKEIHYYGQATTEYMFADLPKLSSVYVPNIKCFKTGFFENDKKLEKILEINSLQSIDNKAFSNCNSLKHLHLPSTVLHIDDAVFDDLGLSEIDFDKNDVYSMEGGFLSSKNGTIIYAPKSIKDNVLIGSHINYIRPYAFANCDKITSVVIENVAFVGDGAFAKCVSLNRVELKNVKELGIGVLQGCDNLHTLSIPFVGATLENRRHISYLFGNLADIPASLEFIELTEQDIIDGTFSECVNVIDIILCKQTKEILSRSFFKCKKLKKLVIPDSVVKIENNTFENCSKGLEIEIASKQQEETFDSHWYVMKKGILFGIGTKKAHVKYRR